MEGNQTVVILPEPSMLYTIQHSLLHGRGDGNKINITMEEDIYMRLRQEVPPKQISAFFSSAVRAKLHPDRKSLDEAYRAAKKGR